MNQIPSEEFCRWIQLIRSEYAEMPGLHLSKRQAQRLWGLDPKSCDVLFNQLEATRFLRRTPTDAYIRADIDY